MSPTYPCIQCLFCKHLFSSSKSLNTHLDHFIPEYCEAYSAPPRRNDRWCHPIPAIRHVRADITRGKYIAWSRDTVRPPDGVEWTFAVVVVCSPPTPLPPLHLSRTLSSFLPLPFGFVIELVFAVI